MELFTASNCNEHHVYSEHFLGIDLHRYVVTLVCALYSKDCDRAIVHVAVSSAINYVEQQRFHNEVDYLGKNLEHLIVIFMSDITNAIYGICYIHANF